MKDRTNGEGIIREVEELLQPDPAASEQSAQEDCRPQAVTSRNTDLTFLLSRLLGSHLGLYWSIPIGWVLGTIHMIWYYRGGKWKEKSLIQTPVPMQFE